MRSTANKTGGNNAYHLCLMSQRYRPTSEVQGQDHEMSPLREDMSRSQNSLSAEGKRKNNYHVTISFRSHLKCEREAIVCFWIRVSPQPARALQHVASYEAIGNRTCVYNFTRKYFNGGYRCFQMSSIALCIPFWPCVSVGLPRLRIMLKTWRR